MLSNIPAKGLDLFTRMATTAAERASVQLGGAIRLAGCESFNLTEDFLSEDLAFEAWAVNTDQQAVVIAVFATAPQDGGGRRMAGNGRFTFTTSNRAVGIRQ